MDFPEKKIFPYHNGAEPVFGDPLALESRLAEQFGELSGIVQKVNAIRAKDADPLAVLEGIQARNVLIAGVREAFELVPFDRKTGQGATDDHALGVYRAWTEWTVKKNGNTPEQPNTSPPTDSISATPAITSTTSASS